MKKKTYISCPIKVSSEVLTETVYLVNASGGTAYYWIKGTSYYDEDFKKVIKNDCAAFVLILPDNLFQIKLSDITSGCRKELTWAMEAKIPLFISCRTMDGKRHLYQADVLFNNTFTGVAETRNEYKKLIQQIQMKENKPLVDINFWENVCEVAISENSNSKKKMEQVVASVVQKVSIQGYVYDKRLLL